MYIIFFIISFLSSIAGSVCGIGGGVIIKPVLDATGFMSVSAISFLSGCTVLSMSGISVLKSFKRTRKTPNLRLATILAVGAALGGVLGKLLFETIKRQVMEETIVGFIQAAALVLITSGTLIYTIFKDKITTKKYKNLLLCFLIGLLLGLMSSFLGIGGGPINLVVLGYCFSMDTKEAAQNSLYIILFSQIASLLQNLIGRNIPQVDIVCLILMVIGGVIGGLIGNKIHRAVSGKHVNLLFLFLMGVIICINLYNVYEFSRMAGML